MKIKMPEIRRLLTAIGCLFFSFSTANAAQFWVSTSGNDSTGTGSSGAPWATLGKARDYIRTINTSMTANITVRIRPGEYVLTSPLELNVSDSGFNGHYVVYKADGGPGTIDLVGGTIPWPL